MNSRALFAVLLCACVVESSSSEVGPTIWLSPVNFLTRTGLSVDISLPRIAHSESCTFITPNHKTVRVEENNVGGVFTYGRSDFVSCRIVVGPMEESLIGKWTICGSYKEGDIEHKRCQSANIVWRNSAKPSSVWQTTIQGEFNHVVYFGGIISPAVRGYGKVVSCHMVTPNKEDLLITRDSEYPSIRLVQDTDSVCRIAIGPINQSHLGSWVIYGKFNSTLGFNEARLPMKFDLSDKNHPYDIAYNVTTLDPIDYVVNFGETVAVEVASSGTIDVCMFTMPSGLSYNTIDPGMAKGVIFTKDDRIACRISIGPITQEMIGTWMLIGRFSNRDVHTQIIQWFNVTLEGTREASTEAYPYYLSTKPTSHDWVLNTMTTTPMSVEDKSHISVHSKSQSDRVLLDIPVSLATDPDMHFAMSLVPMLRQRSLRDKVDVQMNILHFFKSKLMRNQK